MPENPDHLYQKAMKAHREGNHQASMMYFKDLLEIDAQHGKAWYNYANVLADVEEYEDAVEAYQMALELDDSIPSLWYNYGNTLLDIQNFKDAIHAFQKCIKLRPNYVEAQFNLAVTHTELQNNETAIDIYKEIVETDETFHYAWYNLACLCVISDIDYSFYCLTKAIEYQGEDINYQEMAKEDPYFESIKEHDTFLQLITDG